ncbi:hypothetical protein BJ912DRAFT_1087337, partial [Pholiota molesta]
PNRTGITSLPAELLLWIFKLVSSAAKRNTFPLTHYAHHHTPTFCDCEERGIDRSRNTIFPYAPAQVCHQWRGVLSLQPEFWTRIIVSRIPGVHIPPSALEEYLLWSRNLQIEVYVGNVGFERHYARERLLVEQYTKALSPHFHRCTLINYDVRYATSLPCLIRDFPTISCYLTSLQLKSQETHDPLDDVVRMDSVFESRLTAIRSGTPLDNEMEGAHLHKLVLNGRNYLLAAMYMPNSLSSASLEVQNYRANLGRHPEIEEQQSLDVTCHGVLENLKKFTQVEVAFVNVEFSPGSPKKGMAPPLLHDLLRFTCVDSKLIMAAQRLRPRHVVIEECDLSNEHDLSDLHFLEVELINMKEDDMIYFFRRWVGDLLTITDCPGLSDKVFDLMGTVWNASKGKSSWHEIHIRNCTNFSTQAFVRMLRSCACPRMSVAITVCGARKSLSDEDWASLKVLGLSGDQIEWDPMHYSDDSDVSMGDGSDVCSEDEANVIPEVDNARIMALESELQRSQPDTIANWAPIAKSLRQTDVLMPEPSDLQRSAVHPFHQNVLETGHSGADVSTEEEEHADELLRQWTNL